MVFGACDSYPFRTASLGGSGLMVRKFLILVYNFFFSVESTLPTGSTLELKSSPKYYNAFLSYEKKCLAKKHNNCTSFQGGFLCCPIFGTSFVIDFAFSRLLVDMTLMFSLTPFFCLLNKTGTKHTSILFAKPRFRWKIFGIFPLSLLANCRTGLLNMLVSFH